MDFRVNRAEAALSSRVDSSASSRGKPMQPFPYSQRVSVAASTYDAVLIFHVFTGNIQAKLPWGQFLSAASGLAIGHPHWTRRRRRV
jgi:hypothetical protein